jgi:lysophospholipase L1-like esterase
MRRHPLVVALALSLGLCASMATNTTAQAATARVVEFYAFASYPQAGAETTVFGTVTSSPQGTPVQVQVLRSGTWTDVAEVSTDADGGYSHSFVLGPAGSTSYRAVAPATGDLLLATSPTKTLNVQAAPATTFDSAPRPTVTGSHTVGAVLRASPGTWSPTPSKFTYRWIRNGVRLPRYWHTYTVTAEDLGQHLTVAVAAVRSDATTIRESKPGPAVGRGTFTTQPPVIVGTAAVGKTVTADISKWSPQPTTITYQWRRNQSPIPGASSAAYTLTDDDAGTSLSVEVGGESTGIEPVTRTSAELLVPGSGPTSAMSFGDVMDPSSTDVMPSSAVTFTTSRTAPTWSSNTLTRWDKPGAFTHSLTPRPAGTLISASTGSNLASAATGAEYLAGNSVLKNADVEFRLTGRRFAIKYKTYTTSDAMVWIDDRPISAQPIIGVDVSETNRGTQSWIIVTLPERRTVNVRFAGPYIFTGVDAPAADNVTITAVEPPLTLGVVSDSWYEPCAAREVCMSRSAAPSLSTLTGYRVWNMAESATGYINDGSGWYANQTGDGRGAAGYKSSPYGSSKRVAAVRDAPVDALLVNGTVNDQSVWTPSQQLAALEKFLDDVEAARPDLPVVLVGVEPLYYARRTWRIAHYSALTSNLAAMVGRHANVVGFIDPYTDSWLTGSGYAGNPVGDGNQDQYVGRDGFHLDGEGQVYFQGRIADELKDLPLPVAP